MNPVNWLFNLPDARMEQKAKLPRNELILKVKCLDPGLYLFRIGRKTAVLTPMLTVFETAYAGTSAA